MRTSIFRTALILLLGSGLSVPAGARTLPLPQVRPTAGRADTLRFYERMTLVVTALRTGIPLRETPAATALIDRTELAAMPRTIAVDEAVRLVPGVKVDNQADGERVHISMRGQGILS
jgi:outer membrane receptor protein involved in Fe transport